MKGLRICSFILALIHIMLLSISISYKLNDLINEKKTPPLYSEIQKSVDRAYELAPDPRGNKYRVDANYYETDNNVHYEITMNKDTVGSPFALYEGLVRFIDEEADILKFKEYKIRISINFKYNYNHTDRLLEMRNYDDQWNLYDCFYTLSLYDMDKCTTIINSDIIYGIKDLRIGLSDLNDLKKENKYFNNVADMLNNDFLPKLADIETVKIDTQKDDHFKYIEKKVKEKYPEVICKKQLWK